jgi:hypothetical protein
MGGVASDELAQPPLLQIIRPRVKPLAVLHRDLHGSLKLTKPHWVNLRVHRAVKPCGHFRGDQGRGSRGNRVPRRRQDFEEEPLKAQEGFRPERREGLAWRQARHAFAQRVRLGNLDIEWP